LGGVSSIETHPIRQFVEAGIPATLNTDVPLRVWTALAREYAIAAQLGFTPLDLLNFTRNAINAAFTSTERRQTLLAKLAAWQEKELGDQG
jgi:adenosine deaminase